MCSLINQSPPLLIIPTVRLSISCHLSLNFVVPFICFHYFNHWFYMNNNCIETAGWNKKIKKGRQWRPFYLCIYFSKSFEIVSRTLSVRDFLGRGFATDTGWPTIFLCSGTATSTTGTTSESDEENLHTTTLPNVQIPTSNSNSGDSSVVYITGEDLLTSNP